MGKKNRCPICDDALMACDEEGKFQDLGRELTSSFLAFCRSCYWNTAGLSREALLERFRSYADQVRTKSHS